MAAQTSTPLKTSSLVGGQRPISYLKPFNYNPEQVQPLNIAVKDTDEYVVGDILDHKVDDNGDTLASTLGWLQ